MSLKTKNSPKNRSLILDTWEKIFKLLSYISLFKIVCLIKKNVSYRFVEIWVISNVTFSALSILITFYIDTSLYFFYYIFITLGMLRVFEIMVYQINVLLFDPYRASKKREKYKIKSPTRLVVLLFHNYIEIIFWFTSILIAFLKIENNIMYSWQEYLKLNFFYITTFNTTGIMNICDNISNGATLIVYESVVAYIITLITMARFIGLLPQAESIDEV